jgi:hypothetical protein
MKTARANRHYFGQFSGIRYTLESEGLVLYGNMHWLARTVRSRVINTCLLNNSDIFNRKVFMLLYFRRFTKSQKNDQ